MPTSASAAAAAIQPNVSDNTPRVLCLLMSNMCKQYDDDDMDSKQSQPMSLSSYCLHMSLMSRHNRSLPYFVKPSVCLSVCLSLLQ